MKVKSLLVLLIVSLLAFGTVASAANNDYDLSLAPVEYTSGAGYVDVQFVADETVTSVVASATARINYDKTVFALDLANTTTMSPSTVVDKGNYVQWSSQDGISSMAGGTLATIRFNVIAGKEADVAGKEFYISMMVGNKSYDRTVEYTVAKNVKVAVTTAGGGSTVVNEEEFETVTTAPTAGEYADFSSIALGTGATQLAVFGKNASAGLAAYDYGIVVGGVEFPGIADVDAGKYWCIKLVAPEGKDATGKAFLGNYKVKSYIITAEGTKYGDEVTVNVQ